MGILHRLTNKSLVLNKIPFYMEIVKPFKKLRFQIFRDKLQTSSHIIRKCPLRVRRSNKHHCSAGRLGSLQKYSMHPILLLIALEQHSELVITNLSDKA